MTPDTFRWLKERVCTLQERAAIYAFGARHFYELGRFEQATWFQGRAAQRYADARRLNEAFHAMVKS